MDFIYDFKMRVRRLSLSDETISIRPFFSYYGGKWRTALKYYPRPEYDTIVEPFAGSAGYALRYSNLNVILCEIDPIIAEVWRYLIRVRPKEIRSIPDLLPDETVDDLRICQEAKWLVGFWLNRGANGPRKSPSRWMRDGVRPGSFWGNRVRETLASQVNHIRHWKVFNCDYDRFPKPRQATWFVDPPYEQAGQYYKYGSNLLDYNALSVWCKKRRGQVIVCENAGANWLPFFKLGKAKTTRAGQYSKEVFWLNKIIFPQGVKCASVKT